MNPSPLISVIEFLRLTLLPQPSAQVMPSIDPVFISPLPPQYQPPAVLPTPPFTFPLPPTNPDSGGISVLPPFNPIGPYNPNTGNDQNNDGIPDNIADLLGSGSVN